MRGSGIGHAGGFPMRPRTACPIGQAGARRRRTPELHARAGALRRLLEARPTLTRSEAERRLLALVRLAGLPLPETNVRLGRHEVDVLWRENRLVVEVDGYAYHAGREAFERDRRRDADLQAAGHRVIRVTWRRIVNEPEALIATLAQALARA